MAYMLPIEPVIKEIARALSDNISAVVQIPSAEELVQGCKLRREKSIKDATADSVPEVIVEDKPKVAIPISLRPEQRATNIDDQSSARSSAQNDMPEDATKTVDNPWNKSYILSFGMFDPVM
jgi:hypothetical protein